MSVQNSSRERQAGQLNLNSKLHRDSASWWRQRSRRETGPSRNLRPVKVDHRALDKHAVLDSCDHYASSSDVNNLKYRDVGRLQIDLLLPLALATVAVRLITNCEVGHGKVLLSESQTSLPVNEDGVW